MNIVFVSYTFNHDNQYLLVINRQITFDSRWLMFESNNWTAVARDDLCIAAGWSMLNQNTGNQFALVTIGHAINISLGEGTWMFLQRVNIPSVW